MEITINILGLEALTAALNNLAAAQGGKINTQQAQSALAQPVQQHAPVQTAPAYQQVSAPAQTNTMQVYPQPTMPAAPTYAPAQNFTPPQPTNTQPPAQQLPTSHTPQTFTQDQLAVAMTAMCDSGKVDAVMGILAQFGAETLMQVPKEQYAALATMLRGAGANI